MDSGSGRSLFARPTADSRCRTRTRGPRWVVVLSLVAAILALTPAAYANPPDPTWIAGLYDNADFDDVVIFITEAVGAVQPCIIGSRLLSAVGRVERAHPSSSTQSFLSCHFGRAPP